jgi:xanthine dehydrogenase large subunit
MSAAVGQSLPHESARLHVQGQARYLDDLAAPAGCLHGAFGLAGIAHGRILRLDLAAVRAAPGVVAVLTADDIPAHNDCGPIIHDDPILADGLVQFMAQPIFLVVARSHDAARRAARLAVIEYEPLPPLVDIPAAQAADATLMPPVSVAARRCRHRAGLRAASPPGRHAAGRAGALLPGIPDRAGQPARAGWAAC